MVQGAMIPIEKAGETPEPVEVPVEPEADDDMGKGTIVNVNMPGEGKSLEIDTPEIKALREDKEQLSRDLMDMARKAVESDRKLGELQRIVDAMRGEVSAAKDIAAKMPAPTVTVPVTVQPADVTVADTHPSRAVQRVTRDGNGEIQETVIDYEK